LIYAYDPADPKILLALKVVKIDPKKFLDLKNRNQWGSDAFLN